MSCEEALAYGSQHPTAQNIMPVGQAQVAATRVRACRNEDQAVVVVGIRILMAYLVVGFPLPLLMARARTLPRLNSGASKGQVPCFPTLKQRMMAGSR